MAELPAHEWARAVRLVDRIPVLELKRTLIEQVREARNLGGPRRRNALMIIEEICDRLIKLMGGDGDEGPLDIPDRPPRPYVEEELEKLVQAILAAGEEDRLMALVRARAVCSRVIQLLIGFLCIGACPLCTMPPIENLLDADLTGIVTGMIMAALG